MDGIIKDDYVCGLKVVCKCNKSDNNIVNVDYVKIICGEDKSNNSHLVVCEEQLIQLKPINSNEDNTITISINEDAYDVAIVLWNMLGVLFEVLCIYKECCKVIIDRDSLLVEKFRFKI